MWYSILTSILLVGVSAGWLAENLTRAVSAYILRAPITLPDVLFQLKAKWHNVWCYSAPYGVCREVPSERLTQVEVDKALPAHTQAIIRQELGKVLTIDGPFTLHTTTHRVSLACCQATDPNNFALGFAESNDMWIAYKPDLDGNFTWEKLIVISKRHCIAPPALPCGFTTFMHSRNTARWPDHYYASLNRISAFQAEVMPNEVALWDRSTNSANPEVSYEYIKHVLNRLNPLVVVGLSPRQMGLVTGPTQGSTTFHETFDPLAKMIGGFFDEKGKQRAPKSSVHFTETAEQTETSESDAFGLKQVPKGWFSPPAPKPRAGGDTSSSFASETGGGEASPEAERTAAHLMQSGVRRSPPSDDDGPL